MVGSDVDLWSARSKGLCRHGLRFGNPDVWS